MKEKKYLQIKENGACSIFWDFAMFYKKKKIPKQKLTKLYQSNRVRKTRMLKVTKKKFPYDS